MIAFVAGQRVNALLRILGLLSLLLLWPGGDPLAQQQGGAWNGTWSAHWSGGDARLELVQDGTEVIGSIPLHGGQLRGHMEGDTLTGDWSEDGWAGRFEFRLVPDHSSFSGRFDNGAWWTGEPIQPAQSLPSADQSTPRAALRSFLLLGDLGRAGVSDAIGHAAMIMEFGGQSGGMSIMKQVQLAQRLFDLMDLTTVDLWRVPESSYDDTVDLHLAQSGTQVDLPLRLHRLRSGLWWIVAPEEAVMADRSRALLARFAGRLPSRQADDALPTPRDTMRAFLEALPDWDGVGKPSALETLDLRRLPEATRTDEGVMAALSIARVIERVGTVITQTIPDDPNGRNVYVYFTHPQGRIAISPVDEAGHVRWRFTDDTVASARVLYAATSGNPVVPGASLPIPHTAYFSLRAAVAKSAPQLLRPVGDWGMEQWQVLTCLVAVLAGGAVAMLVWLALRYGPSRAAGWSPARRASLSGPPVMLITALAWRFVTPALGLPHGVLAAAHGAAALLLAAAVTWGGWVVLGQVGERLSGGEHGERVSDEIVVPLALGCARVVLIGGMLIYVADALSVPYGGLIAGLGISGLALALASKETLSNIFGAAILVVDRPFRRGDTIAAGDTKGVVEHVGIRSTRIRTAEDSVIVLPNGKLADATINNLGTRRFRLSSASLVLPFATTPETIIAFVDSVRSLANTMPGVVADRTEVSVSALTSAGVQVDMTFYLAVQSGIEERAVRQRLMLAIIGLGDCMGVPVGPSHIPRTPLVTVPLVAAQDNKLAIA